MNILGYDVTNKLPLWPVCEQTIVNTINPHSYYVAKSDSVFTESLRSAHYLIPDGAGIVLAARLLLGKRIKRLTGSDLHFYLLNMAKKHHLKVFYMGAGTITLQTITKRLEGEYPDLKVATYSPPFKPEFSVKDNQAIIEAIRCFEPHILFVGMTAPKQEKWVYTHKHLLKADIICSIGAVFDFYAGTVRRPSRIWRQMGLEWLPRLVREPRRLWRRNLISTPSFLYDVLKARLSGTL